MSVHSGDINRANDVVRRRVLIVTSSYAPTMIADMHRARHLSWELPKLGWDVEILTPDSSYQQACCLDEDSDVFFPHGTKIHFVPAIFPKLFEKLGFRSIGWRSFIPMWQAGRRALTGRAFDLVYFSTSQFPLFLLGPMWRREFGISYVLDFHDPCYKESMKYRAWLRPELKHVASRLLARYVESFAVLSAAGIVSVSPHYVDDLKQRYSATNPAWLQKDRARIIPFAVAPYDLEMANKNSENPAISSSRLRVVYVGSGGPIMKKSFSLVCKTLEYLRRLEKIPNQDIRIELYGTLRDWSEGERKDLADVAASYGVGDMVDECPAWISYRRSLELLQEGDGALVLGVDDAGYMPSKLFTYAYSGKPLLASLRKDGPAFAAFQRKPALGHALWFSEVEEMPIEAAALVMQQFLDEVVRKSQFDRSDVVKSHLVTNMAADHAQLFASVCEA